MRSLNLDQLRTFLAVADTGSFSEAGRRLNLTQPAVSQQVKELEARLGVRLLDRLGKTAHATLAGQELREHALKLLQQSDLTLATMRAFRDDGWSRVRLATSATVCAYVLPQILIELRKRYPRLEVNVAAGPTRELLRRLVNNEFDVAFVNGPAPSIDPALETAVACETSLVAFWPRLFGKPPAAVKPEHLIDKPFIYYTRGNLNRDRVEQWFHHAGCKPEISMEIDTGLSIEALVYAGMGISILPSEVPRSRATMNSVAIRPLDPPLPSQLFVAIHKDKPRNQALRVVHNALLSAKVRERGRGGAQRPKRT